MEQWAVDSQRYTVLSLTMQGEGGVAPSVHQHILFLVMNQLLVTNVLTVVLLPHKT